jgi:hypothetical protein
MKQLELIVWHSLKHKFAAGVVCGDENAAFTCTPERFKQEASQCPKCTAKLAAADARKAKKATPNCKVCGTPKPAGETCILCHMRMCAMRSNWTPEPQRYTYAVSVGGVVFAHVEASNLASAIEDARDEVDRSRYDTSAGPVWVDFQIVNQDDQDDRGEFTIGLDQDEPVCSAEAHDWQSPYEVLGGLREDPGVQADGGGFVARRCCCAHCGAYYIFAQRRDTGEEGLYEVRYQAADEASLAWVAKGGES